MTRKTLIALVLTTWGGFLAWFAATDTMARFLGPRTYWVAWFGAVGLLASGVLSLVGRRTASGRLATRADNAGALVMLVPIVLVVALPAPQLGAQAASRKAVGVGALSSFLPPPAHDGEVGLQEIHYASLSSEYAAALGITEGLDVAVVGFVTHPDDSAGAFGLTRFYISCCAADAVPYTIVVLGDGDGTFTDDTWLSVEGVLVRDGERFAIDRARIERVEEPSAPYLY